MHGNVRSKWFPTSPAQPFNINFWELLALLIAVFSWLPHFHKREIIIHTDNLSLLSIWSKGSRNPVIMRLIRALFFRSASANTNILLHHIPGCHNIHADLLSRLQVPQFRRLLPSADPSPTPIPHDVWNL